MIVMNSVLLDALNSKNDMHGHRISLADNSTGTDGIFSTFPKENVSTIQGFGDQVILLYHYL